MLLSKEELDRSAQPDPQVKEFFDKNPEPEPVLDPLLARKRFDAFSAVVLAKLGGPPAGVTETYHEIPMRDGYQSRLKIFKPSSAEPGPLIVLAFGGGFIVGSCDQLTETARTLVNLYGATVVNISYRLAPEHKFPIAQLDSWDSMKWISENATSDLLHSDPTKGFILGGVSAGGGITGALTRKFQEEPLTYPLTGQWLCIASVLHADGVPAKYKDFYYSLDQNAEAPGLNKQARKVIQEACQWDIQSDLRYAVNSKTPLSGQPRTYSQVDGMDPLRDDGLIYDEMLKDAGVETKLDFYPGCQHAHWVAMRGYEIGERARIDTIVGFAWLLGKSLDREASAKAIGVQTG